MPAYPQANAVGLRQKAATLVQATAEVTGRSKQDIVSDLIEDHLGFAILAGLSWFDLTESTATENSGD